MPPERFLTSMIGYHLEWEGSLCAMAMTQGGQKRVLNIGIGMKQVAVAPKGIPVPAYLQSVAHKVCYI